MALLDSVMPSLKQTDTGYSMSSEDFIPKSLEPFPPGPSLQDTIAAMVEDIHLFEDFEWADVKLLAAYLVAYKAYAGTVIFREGSVGGFLCLVIDGKIDLYKENAQQQRKIVATMGAGKILGEMSLIDDEPRSATGTVVEAATLVILTKENFVRVTKENPALGVKILLRLARLLSQRFRQASGILVGYMEK